MNTVATPPRPLILLERLTNTRDPQALLLLVRDAAHWVDHPQLEAGQRLVAEQIVVEACRLMAGR